MSITISERQKKMRRYMETSLSKYFRKLYIDTYWAGGSPEYSEDRERIICQNRDTIAERYGLKKNIEYSSIPKKYHNQIIVYNFNEIEKKKDELNEQIYSYRTQKAKDRELKNYMKKSLDKWEIFTWARDHIEYYITKDGKIASIFSINNRNTEYESNVYKQKCIEDCGYILIEPIYTIGQNTYIKLIDKD